MLLLDVLYYYLTFCGACVLGVALVVASQVYVVVVKAKGNGDVDRRRRRRYTVSIGGEHGREKTMLE